MACLLALERYQDCLSLVTKEVMLGMTNADVFMLRARLYNFLQKVEWVTRPPYGCPQPTLRLVEATRPCGGDLC